MAAFAKPVGAVGVSVVEPSLRRTRMEKSCWPVKTESSVSHVYCAVRSPCISTHTHTMGTV